MFCPYVDSILYPHGQSKPFIVLFGFHWNLLPTPTLLNCSLSFLWGIQGVILETNATATAGGIPYFFLIHFLQLKHTSSRAFICYSILNRKDMHSQMLLGVEMRWTAVDPDLRRHDRQHVSLESTLLTRLIRFHTFSKVIAFFSPPLLPSVFPILTLITN